MLLDFLSVLLMGKESACHFAVAVCCLSLSQIHDMYALAAVAFKKGKIIVAQMALACMDLLYCGNIALQALKQCCSASVFGLRDDTNTF